MASSEAPLAVTNLGEKTVVIEIPPSPTKAAGCFYRVNKVAREGERKLSPLESLRKLPTIILGFFLGKWKKMFFASCLFAVLLDPLFLYVPMINDDMKCILMDRSLKITVLILRSVTDVFYILDIAYQFYSFENTRDLMNELRNQSTDILRCLREYFFPTMIKTILGSHSILIDILAILPLPQVVILIFFSKMGKVTMNLLVLLQYMPRVLRIYLSSKELTLTGESVETATWVKGVLNFFMYILASHVLGALWYFFSIQRLTTCWQSACRKENGCNTSNFGCYDHITVRNITFVNELCPINSPNPTIFDFGIYTSLLQSGIQISTNYFQKFSNCFWWGLRNLSSVGSNLEPSIDGWENLFAAFISITGLLLFLYLIGNLQLDLGRREKRRKQLKKKKKMEEKTREVELWLAKKGIPERENRDIKLHVIKKVQQELEDDEAGNLDGLFYTLSLDQQTFIQSCMPLNTMKKVRMLQNMDEFELKAICEQFKPRKYTNGNIIIEAGKPFEMMVLIVDGLVKIEDCTCDLQLRGGDLHGQILIPWLSRKYSRGNLLLATKSLVAVGDVEALVLMATDLDSVLHKFTSHFRIYYYEVEDQLESHQTHVKALRLSTDEKGRRQAQ